MADEFSNFLTARMENILSDPQFGAPNAPKSQQRIASSDDDWMIRIFFLVIGVMIGSVICYWCLKNDESDQPETE